MTTLPLGLHIGTINIFHNWELYLVMYVLSHNVTSKEDTNVINKENSNID